MPAKLRRSKKANLQTKRLVYIRQADVYRYIGAHPDI